jgi:hypothetical protein
MEVEVDADVTVNLGMWICSDKAKCFCVGGVCGLAIAHRAAQHSYLLFTDDQDCSLTFDCTFVI